MLNRQRKMRIEIDWIGADAEALLTELDVGPVEVAVVLVSDRAIAELNRSYRGITGPTNVLSFPADEPLVPLGARQLGDVIISVETARREAEEGDMTFSHRMRWLLVHGLLHLLGYDHEVSDEEAERMERLEEQLLASLERRSE